MRPNVRRWSWLRSVNHIINIGLLLLMLIKIYEIAQGNRYLINNILAFVGSRSGGEVGSAFLALAVGQRVGLAVHSWQ